MLADAGRGYFHSLKSLGCLVILFVPALKMGPRLIWTNAVKAMIAEIRFERNQRGFYDKRLGWVDHCELAPLNASSWCISSKTFEDFSIQDL